MIDIDKFVESKKFLYSLQDIKIKDFDFSCMFTKDLKKADKIKLHKSFSHYDNGLEKLLSAFLWLKSYNKEFGVEFREDIKKHLD